MKESRDILSLFEALNSHEIFTPPRVARQMLDLLPQEIWSDPSIKILDPSAKSGVFLRESFYRLFTYLDGKGIYKTDSGEIYDLNNKQQRINHILKNMLFGIATSELTAYVSRRTLYGVMRANSDKQLSAIEAFEQSSNFHQWTEQEKYNFIGRNKFNEYFDHNLFCTPDYEGFEEEGNIFYPNDEVKKLVMEEDDYEIEDKYFPFIEENTKHKKILDIKGGLMRFDVVISNPPYQKQDKGASTGASPIYQHFIEGAKKLNPKYIVMIIPSRWFAGGKGLGDFRASMLTDKRVSQIVDFTDARDCFPGVDIAGGVCYFLWNSSYRGECSVIGNHFGTTTKLNRYLDEYPTFIRDNIGVELLRIIVSDEFISFSENVSSRKPFGLSTNERPKASGDLKLIFNKGDGPFPRSLVTVGRDLIDKWKVVTSKVSYDHGGQPDKDGRRRVLSKVFILKPGEICTETYIIAGVFNDEETAKRCESFLKTKFVRFLISLMSFSQDITKERFRYVPSVDFSESWSDERLRQKFGLSDSHWDHIDRMIRDY
ncbi:Eco57I restriction-modification methylase domain-containing protein [Acinetobacter towneri]|uniref:Eco57I restriction-modification methylase domain-containing protein n=1 Tax=Acinetobacter towneri TaxID=202956 RepID=UPI0034D58D58